MPVYPFESTIKDGNRTVQIGDQLLLPQKNNAANPSLAFGDGDTGFYESSPNVLSFSCGGVEFIYFDASGNIKTSTSGRWGLLNEAPTATNPDIVPNRSDVDTGIGAAALDQLSLIAGGVEGHRITEVTGDITHELTGVVNNNSAKMCVIAAGSYTGDSSVNNAIAHGLGVIPKAIDIRSTAASSYIYKMIEPGKIYYNGAGTDSSYAVTNFDITNFYVGNAGGYSESANLDTTVYFWVAYG